MHKTSSYTFSVVDIKNRKLFQKYSSEIDVSYSINV